MKYSKYPSYKDSEVKWLGKIPEHWQVPAIKMLLSVHKGLNMKKNPTVLSVTLKGIKVKDIDSGEGQLAATYDNYNPVTPNHIVLNPMDLISGFVGKPPIKGVVSPAYISISVPKKCNTDFYVYLFQKLYYEKILFPYGKGVSYDFRWTINNETFFNLPTLYPPLQEQKVIANYLDIATAKIDTLIEKQIKLIELLKEKRQAIISTAVTRGLDSSVAMKDTGIEWLGEIPKHWTKTPLRYLGRLQNGISKGGDYFGSGYPFVNYGDIYKNATLPQQVSGLAKSTKEDQHIYSVKTGDVFFTRTSETIDDIGMASTCIKTIKKGTFSGFTIRFRQLAQTLNEHFSKYYFRTGHSQAFFEKQLNLVTRASLGQDILKQLPVLIPPMNEQSKIAQFLDSKTNSIDTLILKATKSINLLKEKRIALISSVVTGKIDMRESR